MKSRIALLAVVVAGLFATGCHAPAPAHAVFVANAIDADEPADVVRASDRALAIDVGHMLAELKPAVLQALPGTRDKPLEVWVQDELALYRGESAGHDVDGFHVVDTGRIHLRASDEGRMRATLAHEIVHALVDSPWRRLPPVIEEGVADWVAARVCGDMAPRIRAGRLGDACGALGGLSMRLRFEGSEGKSVTVWPTRIVLANDASVDLETIFAQHVHGLDALKASTDVRPGLYGCGFLVVDRIASRRGIERLFELCREADARGDAVVTREELLTAAHLTMSSRTWTLAAARALLPADVRELGRRHAHGLVTALGQVRSRATGAGDAVPLATLSPEWGPTWGDARVQLDDIPAVRRAMAELDTLNAAVRR